MTSLPGLLASFHTHWSQSSFQPIRSGYSRYTSASISSGVPDFLQDKSHVSWYVLQSPLWYGSHLSFSTLSPGTLPSSCHPYCAQMYMYSSNIKLFHLKATLVYFCDGQNDAPPRFPCSNSWNMWLCYLTWQKGLRRCMIKDLEVGRLFYNRWTMWALNVIARVLIWGKQESQNQKGSRAQRERLWKMLYASGFEFRKEPQAKECRWFQKLERAKE